MSRMTNAYQTATDGSIIPKQITGKVTRVERIGLTVWGNPIVRIHLEATSVDGRDQSGVYRISDNASLVYEIGNGEFRDEPHTFHLTRAGRISHRER